MCLHSPLGIEYERVSEITQTVMRHKEILCVAERERERERERGREGYRQRQRRELKDEREVQRQSVRTKEI